MFPASPGGVGAKLREAREQRGIPLRQIANATKITVASLDALERNDLSKLPGGIFTRAFVRSYSAAVGLDPEDMIREFVAQFPQESVTAAHPTASRVDDGVAIERDRRSASTFVWLIALSLPIAGIVLYVASGRRW